MRRSSEIDAIKRIAVERQCRVGRRIACRSNGSCNVRVDPVCWIKSSKFQGLRRGVENATGTDPDTSTGSKSEARYSTLCRLAVDRVDRVQICSAGGAYAVKLAG